MRRLAGAVAIAAVILFVTGCGASDEQEVARALESYPHALAAGDARVACDAFSPDAQREMASHPGEFCAFLRQSAPQMTPEQRRDARAAKAVRVEVEGDRATGYLRYGECIVRTSKSELTREDSGDWRIQSMGGVSHRIESRCLDR